MSPRQRLEERIHTFSAPLDFGSRVPDLMKQLKAINVGDAPAAVPYGIENRGRRAYEALSVWTDQFNEKRRLEQELSAIGTTFNSYVASLRDSFLPHGLEHNGQQYFPHGDVDVCAIGATMDDHSYVRAESASMSIPGTDAVRFGLQPGYRSALKPLLSILTREPGPRYATKATLWALHPEQGTTDANYLFTITMDKAEINPLGIPSGAEDRVVDVWHKFLKLAGYDNVINIDTRRRPSAEIKMPEYVAAHG